MKVICDRAALLDAVNLVTSVAPSRSPKPQLTCVRRQATRDDDAGLLSLAATDTEVSLTIADANVEVQSPGEALVPADKLRQIVQAEDADATLTIETDNDAVHIRGADAKFTVFGYPAGEFPPIPRFADAGDHVITIGARELVRLVSRTLFATARETSRYAINGVLLKVTGKKLELVATDGRRLAHARGSIADGALSETESVSCIIPSKAMGLVSKLVGGRDEPVRIGVTDNQAFFALGDPDDEPEAVVSCSLVEGAFPPYEDVIPRDQDKRATFEVDSITSAFRRAALLTNEESRGVRLSFQKEGGKGGTTLRLSSRAPEMGEAEITVGLDEFDGEDIEIGFNPQFILDALKVVDSDHVVFEMKAPNKPGTLKSDTDFVYVVMPVNLQ
jgi:DNA polymerase-3 subunit beta